MAHTIYQSGPPIGGSHLTLLLLLFTVKHSQSFVVNTGDGASMEDLRETARRMTADSCFRDKAIKIIARQDAQAEN